MNFMTSTIFGFHTITTKLRHDADSIVEILISKNRIDPRSQKLRKDVIARGIKLREVAPERIQAIVPNGNHQGVVALVNQQIMRRSEEDLFDNLEGAPVLLALDGVSDPQNMGAIFRSAACFGVSGILVPKDNSVGVTETVTRVSCGGTDIVPYYPVTNLVRTVRKLKDCGYWVVGADMNGDKEISDVDFSGPTVVIFGGEGSGMRRLTRENCDFLANIPIGPELDSLNVSVSIGIFLYEISRQRSKFTQPL